MQFKLDNKLGIGNVSYVVGTNSQTNLEVHIKSLMNGFFNFFGMVVASLLWLLKSIVISSFAKIV